METNPIIKFKKLRANAVIPEYKSEEAAGFDLHAAIDAGKEGKAELSIATQNSLSSTEESTRMTIVKTGLAVSFPKGYELQIRPRSGLAAKHGITVVNSPGTIDSDYRGEIMVILANLGPDTFTVKHGDRIAQAVLCPVARANIVEVEELDETVRGEGGLGSTGSS